MELLVQPSAGKTLTDALRTGEHADYVYMYPPRQAYAEIDYHQAGDLVVESLDSTSEINLYAHFPFCQQICNFCNLYTTIARGPREYTEYIDLIVRELDLYLALVGKNLAASTVYLGGGTPSLLSTDELAYALDELLARVPRAQESVETAIEIDPATVDVAYLRRLNAVGINRINLGFQSTQFDEILQIGRRHVEQRPVAIISEALGVGFANVCVDLIYGLSGQTDRSWIESLETVSALQPQTICCYALTSRDETGYDAHGYRGPGSPVLYRRYDAAVALLADAGYKQETHVRWVLPGGGYQQKENHWKLQPLLGLGAGARSYLWRGDFRNGYSIVDRKSALRDYEARVRDGRLPITDGIVMDDDERGRKAAILGISHLERQDLTTMLGFDPVDRHKAVFEEAADLGLVTLTSQSASLTADGWRHKDILAQAFFSEGVRKRLGSFNYAE